MMTERSAGVLIFRGKPPQFLLLHYPAGHWDFPKGNIEVGETEEQTALRELEEETGITDAKIIPGFKGTVSYFYRREGKTIHKTVVDFLAETQTEKVTLSHEHIGFKWLGYEEALKQLTFKSAQDELKKAWSFLQKRKTIADFR